MVAQQIRFVTNATWIRATASMCGQMPGQFALRGEALIAMLTLEWLIRLMDYLMPFQPLLERKTFSTVIAGVRTLLLMVLRVLLPFVFR